MVRQISNLSAQTLPATFISGLVNIGNAYEADVAPRPSGDNNGTVTITDWVQVGRFAAGLDQPSTSSEYQRADCAPRSTVGDGAITITDWVQAGRYAAALDPVTLAGGLTGPSGAPARAHSLSPRISRAQIRTLDAPAGVRPGDRLTAGPRPDATWSSEPEAGAARSLRQVRLVTTAPGNPATRAVIVELDALGGENGLGFTASFDPRRERFIGAALVDDAANGTLIVHDLRTGEGLIGIALALPTGRSFPAGTRQLARLSFESTTTNGSPDLKINFNDELVAMELASVLAEALPAAFMSTGSGSIQNAATSGKFTVQGFEVTFAVLSDSAYVIEISSDLTHWTPLATQVPVNGIVRFTDGHSGEASVRFYRARKATVGVGEKSL